MIDYKKLKIAHQLATQIVTHYMVHITGGKYPTEHHEFTLVNWNPEIPDMNFKSIDCLIEILKELSVQTKKEIK